MSKMKKGRLSDPRLHKIENTERIVLSVQAAMMVLFALYVAFLNGISLAPLYIPLENMLLVFCILFALIGAERLFFFIEAMHYSKKENSRCLVSRKNLSNALSMIVLVSLIFLILLLPYLNIFSTSGTATGNPAEVKFQGSAVFSLADISYVQIRNIGPVDINYSLIPASLYYSTLTTGATNETIIMDASILGSTGPLTPGSAVSYTVSLNPKLHYLLMFYALNSSAEVQYTLRSTGGPVAVYSMAIDAASIVLFAANATVSRRSMKMLRGSTIYA